MRKKHIICGCLGGGGGRLIILTCSCKLSWIAKDAAQGDRVEGFLRAPLAATLWLMSDHGAQLRWKGQLGANPNPPCQHSLWEETGVPGENPRLSAEHWLTLFAKYHVSVILPYLEPLKQFVSFSFVYVFLHPILLLYHPSQSRLYLNKIEQEYDIKTFTKIPIANIVKLVFVILLWAYIFTPVKLKNSAWPQWELNLWPYHKLT